MRYVKSCLLIIIVFLAQIAVIPNMAIKFAFPNLIFLFALSYALNFKFEEAIFWAAIGGILLDLYSPFRFGVFTLLLIGIVLAINFIFNKFISEPIFPIIIATIFIASLIFDLVPFLIYEKDVKIYLFNAIYNTIVGTVLYYFIASFKSRENPYKVNL